MTPEEVQQMIRDTFDKTAQQSQFTTIPIAFHTHNGIDSPKLPFIGLSDTPNSYHGKAGKVATVNSTENALTFGSAGGAQTATFVVGPASNSDSGSYNYTTTGTNDDVQINAALSALPTGGGRVILREGTYSLSNTVTTYKANTTIEGQGTSTLLNWAVDTTSTILTIVNDNCWLKNLKIDGQQNGKTNIFKGVSIAAAYDRITNCTVVNTTDCNIFVDNTSASNALIQGNILDTTQSGAGNGNIRGGVTSGEILIEDNIISNGDWYGIYLLGTGGTIQNNVCFHARTGNTIQTVSGRNTLISGNYVEVNRGTGIYGAGGFASVVGNTVYMTGGFSGIKVDSNSSVVGNTIYNTSTNKNMIGIDAADHSQNITATVASNGAISGTSFLCATGLHGYGAVTDDHGNGEGTFSVTGASNPCANDTCNVNSQSFESYQTGDGTYRMYLVFTSSGTRDDCGSSGDTNSCNFFSNFYIEAVRSGGTWKVRTPIVVSPGVTSDVNITGNNIYLSAGHSAFGTFSAIQVMNESNVSGNLLFVNDTKVDSSYGVYIGGNNNSLTNNTIDLASAYQTNGFNSFFVDGTYNSIIGNSVDGITNVYGVHYKQAPIIISNNKLRKCYIHIDGVAAGSALITGAAVITGNEMDGVTAGSGIIIGDNGGSTVQQSDCTITGNSIANMANEGINLSGVQYSTISCNTIRNIGQAANNTYAAILLQSAGGNHSIYNTLTGNTIHSDAANVPSYGIRENSASDGPSIITSTVALNAATAQISTQNGSSVTANNLTV